MEKLVEKIRGFQPRNILVIGDLMLDKYSIGDASRLSPEAPVPVIEITKETYSPGGAGNTAVNISTMGSQPYLIGLLGDDNAGEIFKQEIDKRGISSCGIKSLKIGTPVKQRIVARGQQVARLDYNDNISHNEGHILSAFSSLFPKADVVVISDYGKGTLSGEAIEKIIASCNNSNKLLIIDPKPSNSKFYVNSSFITPNLEEAAKMVGKEFPRGGFSGLDYVKEVARDLREKLNTSVILTLGAEGILYYDSEFTHFPTYKREVRDVSGAGDTVVAALAVGLANGLDIYDAILLANHAGGVAVEKSGVQSVSLDEIIEDIKRHNNLK